MLMFHKDLWLIDHGAALYFHHSWDNWKEQAVRPFVQVKDHVLLPFASRLEEVDAEFRTRLTLEKITEIVGLIPDDWLDKWSLDISAHDIRQVYIQFLQTRLTHSHIFLKEAQHARK
jgi:hypothetical protein